MCLVLVAVRRYVVGIKLMKILAPSKAQYWIPKHPHVLYDDPSSSNRVQSMAASLNFVVVLMGHKIDSLRIYY